MAKKRLLLLVLMLLIMSSCLTKSQGPYPPQMAEKLNLEHEEGQQKTVTETSYPDSEDGQPHHRYPAPAALHK